MMDQIIFISVLLFFPAAMAFAAATDLVSMTISNRISLGLIVFFFILAPVSGMGIEQMGWHVLAGAILLLAGFAMFAFGWIGGGDAKLLAVTALWFGFSMNTVEYLLASTLLGGGLTMLMLVYRHFPVPAFLYGQGWAMRLHDEKEGIPYGLALAAGALLIYPNTWWMVGALGY